MSISARSGRCFSLPDDDSSYIHNSVQLDSDRRSTEIRSWDYFDVSPSSVKEYTTSNFVEYSLQVLKGLSYIFTFLFVLGCALIAKSTLLLMTSSINSRKNLTLCNQQGYIHTLPREEIAGWVWALYIAMCIPEMYTFLKCMKKNIFKKIVEPPKKFIIFALIYEGLHSAGVVLFIFMILPDIDVVEGALLMQCVCILPAILNLFSRSMDEKNIYFKLFLDVLAILGQLSIVVIIIVGNLKWISGISLFLISFNWIENYIEEKSFSCFKTFGKLKKKLQHTRYSIYALIAIYKCALNLLLTFVTMQFKEDGFNIFYVKPFSNHNITIKWNTYDIKIISPSEPLTPIYVMLIQIASATICFYAGKFACRICIQPFSFALPLVLVGPVLSTILLYGCAMKYETKCYIKNVLPNYLSWNCRPTGYENNWFLNQDSWILYFGIIWLLSQSWVTRHTWISTFISMESTEKLFTLPYFNGLLIDQSMALNRRRVDSGKIKKTKVNSEPEVEIAPEVLEYYYEYPSRMSIGSGEGYSADLPEDLRINNAKIPKVIACATMWHETPSEMRQMLKSIMRMDEDQSSKKYARKYFDVVDPDYYEFETNIFFDDAFEISDINDDWNVMNRFVKQFISEIDKAALEVYKQRFHISSKKTPTPYGGRLEWQLPGKTKLIVHLKDKAKIRHRKRWSQVMYMYYLLGFKLTSADISENERVIRASNTFILALDGDIDFRPKAVHLLVDLMKKNHKLGSACGRIHPIGAGPMVWFQKFEYAIGHWLQKATEHMIGCVLCSPGCFSIFRAQALMDFNVMKKYTTKSEEAKQYVQFDQGEDRWLCTLILQQGYRIEYSAASDAYTHAPEGFQEFFQQRRRWVPSTMANIMDLLTHYRKTVAVNNSISLLYILYQAFLMFGTVIGPGTIFLMIVSALNSVFPGAFTIWTSFWINFTIVALFSISCYFGSSKMQLMLAQIFTIAYCFMMMAVLVGTCLQFSTDYGSPPTLFTTVLFVIFFFAAFIHPQEITCVITIVPLVLYWLLIPSMYLLLNIYSFVNMNNVTWGTREVATKKTKAELEEEKRAEAELKKKAKSSNALLSFLQSTFNTGNASEENGLSFSFGNLCKCLLCWAPSPNVVEREIIHIGNRIEKIEGMIGKRKTFSFKSDEARRRASTFLHRDSFNRNSGESVELLGNPIPIEADALGELVEKSEEEDDKSSEDRENLTIRDDLINPLWIEDELLRRAERCNLPEEEIIFWKEFIAKYLYPLIENKDQQAQVAKELINLRNKYTFGFFILNGLFIVLIFMLQIAPQLRFCMPKYMDSMSLTNNTYCRYDQYELEPVGLAFVFLFALILVIQFTAMLFHRFDTLCHLLAKTKIQFNFKSELNEDITGFNLIKILGNFHEEDFDDNASSISGTIGKKRTLGKLKNIFKSRKQKKFKNLEEYFKLGLKEFDKQSDSKQKPSNERDHIRRLSKRMNISEQSVKQLVKRRTSVIEMQEKRLSMMYDKRRHIDNENSEEHNKTIVEIYDAEVPKRSKRVSFQANFENSKSTSTFLNIKKQKLSQKRVSFQDQIEGDILESDFASL